MNNIHETSELIKEIDSYLKYPKLAENDISLQNLSEEKLKLEKELAILMHQDLITQSSGQPRVPLLESTNENGSGQSLLKSSYRQTELEVFSFDDEKFKVVLKPKLELSESCEEFYITFKTNERGLPDISTDLPCFIQYGIEKTIDLAEYVSGLVKRLECYLQRKQYADVTQKKIFLMSDITLEFSFSCAIVELKSATVHGSVTYWLIYDMDGTHARDVYVKFDPPQQFTSSLKYNFLDKSKVFKSNNLYEAFCHVFDVRV